MIIFFYGPDTYRLSYKVRQLKEKFISSSLGDTNLIVLDGKTTTSDEIIRQGLAMPFLSKTRLVILENFLRYGKKETQEKIIEFLPKIPSSTVFAFVEDSLPDKRIAIYKKLIKLASSQEFILLEGEALRRWVKKEIESRGGVIDNIALIKLIDYVGADLWRMSNEIAKLTNYNKQLTVDTIELLVIPEVRSNIFDLIDSIAVKNPKMAFKELYRLINNGENEIYILTMIVYQYRNLLITKDIQTRFPTCQRGELAKKTGLHPFVLGKTLAISSKYTFDGLKMIYQKLLDYDNRLKVGKIEPKVALELLVFELTK